MKNLPFILHTEKRSYFNDMQDWQNLLKNIYMYQQHQPALEEYFPHLEIVT